MRFSSRFDGWDLRDNALTRARKEREEAGGRILDLTVTNPTDVGLGLTAAEIREALGAGDASRYRPSPRGLRSAREAVARLYREQGARVDPEDVFLTAGSSEAYSFLFKLLADPGNLVAVPRPSYPLFDYLAALDGLRAGPYALSYRDGWALDPAEIDRVLGEGARVVLAVHPNNPTGSYLKRHEADLLLDRCAGRHVPVVCDEVFLDYVLDERAERPRNLAGSTEALVFRLGGLSKSLALPQLKLGWIAIAGPRALRQEAAERLEIVADTYLSVSTPVQLALPSLLERREEVQGRILSRLRANLARLRSATSGTPCTALECEGGWSAIVRLPRVRDGQAWALRLLEADGVLAQPGYLFDLEGEAYLVLGLLARPATFEEGIALLVARVTAES